MKKAAFTLIELIIAISIIAIVVGVFLANYYGGETQSQLINATSGLMRDLRTAQTKGVANISYGSDIPSGWGINMVSSSSQYTIFADVNGNRLLDSGTEDSVTKGAKEIALPEGITISSITNSPMNIVFYSEQGVLKASMTDGSVSLDSPVEIVLQEASTGETKTVYVNPFGLIYSNL